jgi:hypothetical protein
MLQQHFHAVMVGHRFEGAGRFVVREGFVCPDECIPEPLRQRRSGELPSSS